ncbi:Receptor-like protein 43 [Linum perenne]
MASVVVAVLVIGSLCHLCSFVSPTQTLCLDSERTLLVQIKHEIFINTSFWGIQPLPSPKVWSWNDSRNHKDCCLWEGITCDSYSGHVVGLDLSSSNIVGGINSSSSIFHLHHLQSLSLAHNRLDISGSSFPYGFNNLSSLIHLNLSHAGFGGSIPEYDISTLGMLVSLDLSNFASSVDMEKLVKNLTRLRVLKLDGCRLYGTLSSSIFLIHNLQFLDVSYNYQLTGSLPEFPVSNIQLQTIILLNTNFSGKPPDSIKNLVSLQRLDLHSCKFYGTFPSSIFLLPNLQYLDVSKNTQLTGSLPEFPISGIPLQTIYLSNKINGNISPSLCDMKFLAIIDLSSNHLNGSIPSCLVSLESLGVLSLKNNKLSGMLPKDFAHGCSLMTLDVNQNNIEGQIPESLGFCPYLEVVDVGKNNLTGKFPFWLEDLPALRVLVLHSNKFGGSIDSQNPTGFPVLQILDVSFNKFVGKLPSRWFRSWNGMMKSSTMGGTTGNYIFSGSSSYQNSVTVIVKGTEREYPKILNIFVLLDVSNNNFVGEIPETIGHLESLELLNLSNNHFTGHIPQSFEQLRKLESLDFSSNNLSGSIPSQLTKLTFLSVFNTSHNSLSGEIPIGKQFDTFDANSYLGNRELCGKPLPKPCFEVKSAPSSATSPTVKGWKSMIDWNCFRDGTACGWGAGVILGIVIAKLVYGNPFIPPKTKRVRRIAVRPLRNYS